MHQNQEHRIHREDNLVRPSSITMLELDWFLVIALDVFHGVKGVLVCGVIHLCEHLITATDAIQARQSRHRVLHPTREQEESVPLLQPRRIRPSSTRFRKL